MKAAYSDPVRRRNKLKLIGWITVSLVVACGAYAAYHFSRPPSPSRAERVAQLNKSIKSELPAKATRTQLKAWLHRHKISYGYMDGKKYKLDDESFVVESGIPVKDIRGVITGGFSVPAEELFEDNCSINLAFFMDKNDRVIKHQVGWVCGGL